MSWMRRRAALTISQPPSTAAVIIYGINPVLEALRAATGEGASRRRCGGRAHERPCASSCWQLAASSGVPSAGVCRPTTLDRDSQRGVHQGVVADVEEVEVYSVEDLVRGARSTPLIVVLDGIEDPHNLGAILRTADAAGVDGVVVQSRRSAALGGAAAKASAGAVAHVRIAEVVNIARAIEELKEPGVWTVGLAGEAPTPYDAIDFTLPDGIGPRRGGFGAAASGTGTVRPPGSDPDAGACREPECVGCRRNHIVRGGPPASDCGPDSLTVSAGEPGALIRLAREVLLSALCLAGVAQSGRAADL